MENHTQGCDQKIRRTGTNRNNKRVKIIASIMEKRKFLSNQSFEGLAYSRSATYT